MVAIEFGLHLEGKTREEITPEERETYVLKPGEVYELCFTVDRPVLSMERLRTYMDKMLALKNDHPELALLYLSLDLGVMSYDKTKLVVQTSVLPTEKVVKPQVGPLMVLGYMAMSIGIIIAATFFVKEAGHVIIEVTDKLIDFFIPGRAEKERHEKNAEILTEKKAEVDKDIHHVEEEIENKKLKLEESKIPYDKETGEILLPPEAIAKLPAEQQEVIADYKEKLRELSEKEELSRKLEDRAERERKAAEEALGEPRWWLIGGVLGVAGLAAATGLIKALRKD